MFWFLARVSAVWNLSSQCVADITTYTMIPSASTVLRDAHSPPPVNNAAMHAIKSSRTQLNNLITRIGTATGRTNEQLKPSILQVKLSKLKREAEESDANYRSALHHLETLRMQRERVSKASLTSLHEFCFDLSFTCKSIFTQYCDSWAGKARQTETVSIFHKTFLRSCKLFLKLTFLDPILTT